MIALSGGLDSTVLLHALATLRPDGVRLEAVHVDHGLQPSSADWATHCARLCQTLDIPLLTRRVDARARTGESPEARARAERYAVLAGLMQPGSVVFTAHHRDDQAETLLLNLARGSGPHGLAAMAPRRAFASGELVRPLLPWGREDLLAWARAHLDPGTWIEDPSNTDTRLRRNALRHDVLPALEDAFPGSIGALARSCELQAESANLLDDLADLDLACLDTRVEAHGSASLNREALANLSPARAANALRQWFRTLGLGVPPRRRLLAGLEMMNAPAQGGRDDGLAHIAWQGAVLRRWHDRIHVHRVDHAAHGYCHPLTAGEELHPRDPRGTLHWCSREGALDTRRINTATLLLVPVGRARTIKPRARPRQAVRDLLRAQGVPPWLRDSYPAIVCEGELIALPGIAVHEPWCVPADRMGLMPYWSPQAMTPASAGQAAR